MSLVFSGSLLPTAGVLVQPARTPAPAQRPPQPQQDPKIYVTGHCSIGNHEGARPTNGGQQCRGEYAFSSWTDGTGRRVKTKPVSCDCSCHEPYRQMEALTGVRAVKMEIFPSPSRVRAMLYGPPVNGRPAGDHGPTGVVGQENSPFRPTKSGRRARGELEAMVARVVMTWFQGKPEPAMAALEIKFIQMALKKDAPDKTFSSGAILRCLQRWSDKSWVELKDKPHRIVQPTDRGIEGLKKWA